MGLPRFTIKGRCIACTARDRSIAAGITSIADDVDAFLLPPSVPGRVCAPDCRPALALSLLRNPTCTQVPTERIPTTMYILRFCFLFVVHMFTHRAPGGGSFVSLSSDARSCRHSPRTEFARRRRPPPCPTVCQVCAPFSRRRTERSSDTHTHTDSSQHSDSLTQTLLRYALVSHSLSTSQHLLAGSVHIQHTLYRDSVTVLSVRVCALSARRVCSVPAGCRLCVCDGVTHRQVTLSGAVSRAVTVCLRLSDQLHALARPPARPRRRSAPRRAARARY